VVGFGDLLGRSGWLESLVVWGLLSEVLHSATGPALELLRQDMNAKNPVMVLDPTTLAGAAVRGMTTIEAARADAARNGLDADRFATLVDLQTVRLAPGDLATAVLRSYMTAGEAQAQAAPQGLDAAQFAVLTDLAGDGIAPTDAVRALLRGLIAETGSGASSTSYDQAIAESRLHNKWGPVLKALAAQLLSPADAADAVVRNFLTTAEGEAVAGKQGFSATDFETLVHLSGDAPGPQQLAESLRRGLIPQTGTGSQSISFEQGIAESRLADKWAPVVEGLAKIWPSPVNALDAQVKGQLTADEASALYAKLGGDPQFESWLYNSIGEGPSPLEAANLAARGIIPWTGTGAGSTSYEQAVKESHYRDKWTPAYRALAEHIPAPSTVIALLAHRIIDEPTATAQLLQNDMTPEQAATYVAEAGYQSISEYRGLAQSAVVDMYFAHLLDKDQATEILTALHVSPDAIALILAYADMRYQVQAMNRTVSRLATLFATRKIGESAARAALTKLGVPVATVTEVIAEWELQASMQVKTLTEAQIVDGWYYNVIPQAQAVGLLTTIGYTPYDAWVVLSVKNKAPLPDQPAADMAVPQPAVTPGTT
jgi:hypothetical protein